MRNPNEDIQILFDIAMSIGEGKDLHESSKKALSTYLRKLNCFAGAVIEAKVNMESLQCNIITSIPKYILNRNYFKDIVDLIHLDFAEGDGLENLKKRLPLIVVNGDNTTSYLMELPDYGFIVFVKQGEPLDDDILYSLGPLNSKFAIANNSFMNREELAMSEKRFQLLSNSTFESVFLFSKELCINQNAKAEKVFGYDLKDIYNKRIEDFIKPYNKEDVIKLSSLIDADLTETVVVRKDSSMLTCEIRGEMAGFEGEDIAVIAIRDISHRKTIETELLESKKRFQEITDLLPQPIWETDAKGVITYSNKAGYEIMGYSQNDLNKNLGIENMFVEKDRERLIDNFKSRLLNHEAGSDEYTCCTQNGKIFEALVYSSPLDRNVPGAGLRGIVVDISVQKQIEKKLKESNDRFNFALLATNAGLWDWNVLNDEVYYNNRWCEMLGYSREEIEPNISSWKNLIHPDDFDYVMEKHQEHFDGKVPMYTSEHRLRKKDGSWLWIQGTGKIIEYDSDGNPLRVVGTNIDISKRKKNEFEIEQNLKRQEILSDIALELNTLEDFDVRVSKVLETIGQFTRVSRVYIFEDHEDGLLTDNTFEWCNNGVVPQKDELQDLSYVTDIPSWKVFLKNEGRVYSENISELPQDLIDVLEPQDIKSIVVYPLFVMNKYFGFIGFDECTRYKHWSKTELELLRTISGIIANAYERKIMEQSIIEERDNANRANRAKSEFLANMSHEIRTPMNAILGFSEVLYHNLEKKEDRDMVTSVVNSGNLLLSLLNDILDLSKIEAGKLVISPQPIDLVSIANEIHTLFKNKADSKGIKFNVIVDDDFPETIRLDEIRIKQILFNLLGNAIKFTHKGFVNLVLKFKKYDEKSGKLVILVDDSGIGISDDAKDSIFEAFKQSNDSGKRYDGVGLGLAISKRLVEKMDGTISVKSSLGVGSTFQVILPTHILKDKVYKGKETVYEVHNVRFKNAKILVVDDVMTNIEMIESYLASSNLVVSSAENGQMGLEILKHTLPDVILLDMRMPGLSGMEVAKRIKENSRTKNIPVIAFTASVFSADEIEKSGYFGGFLYKPVSRDQLIGELMKFLPHTIIDDKKQERSTESGLSFDPKSYTGDLGKVVKKLESEFLPVWEGIKDHLVLFEIEEFSAKLGEYADDVNLRVLKKYAEKLNVLLTWMEFEELKTHLGSFPDIINLLKENLEHYEHIDSR